jgi:DNA-binding NtrC family response regulator
MSPRIIVVDDDRDYLELAAARLKAHGFTRTETLDDPLQAAAAFRSETDSDAYDLAVVDVSMPEMSGQAVLDLIKHRSPDTECIMVTAVNDARTAIECLRKGAYDYLVKPVSEEDLIFAVKRALERKRLLDILYLERTRLPPAFSHPAAFRKILTRSRSILRVLKEAELHAASDVPILITGESGTGKELLARAIHAASPRAGNTFLPVNMAALSGGLFEAEFFGHTRGAFTGAEKERGGHLRHCDRGTLFLDEIGNLPLTLQGKLLRVLQDGEFTPVGSSLPQKADVRFVAATNEDLDRMIASGRFRRDLFYRIRGSWLHLPPLRERREDIPLLVERFIEGCRPEGGALTMDEAALGALMDYRLPGNVRELKSIVQSAVNLARGREISLGCLPPYVQNHKAACGEAESAAGGSVLPLSDVERRHILSVYRQLDGNKMRTARALGLGLNTLRRRLKHYPVD